MLNSNTLSAVTAEESKINAEFAEKYGQTDLRDEAAKKIEASFVKLAEKQVEILQKLDVELKRMGIDVENLDNTPKLTPDEYLTFVLENQEMLLPTTTGPVEKNLCVITDEFELRIKTTNDEGLEYTDLVGGNHLFMCSFLTQRGVDITKVDIEKILELGNAGGKQILKEFNMETYDAGVAIRKIINEERNTYAKGLKQDLTSATTELAGGANTDNALNTIHQTFELYKHIPGLISSDTAIGIIQPFEELIRVKKTLPLEVQSRLNALMESDEKVILDAIGEEYFESMTHLRSYEEAYMSVFGLTQKNLWERRQRNWVEVKRYIEENIGKKRFIEVDDLRQLHIISSRGVLPYLCYGFRSDRNSDSEWYHMESNKQEVQLSNKNATHVSRVVAANKIKEELEILVNKANKLGHSQIPPVVFNVSLGNLFAEYIRIHPHPDGNGTTAIFFADAVKAISPNNFAPTEKYERNFLKRLNVCLGNNPIAINITKLNILINQRRNRLTTSPGR